MNFGPLVIQKKKKKIVIINREKMFIPTPERPRVCTYADLTNSRKVS